MNRKIEKVLLFIPPAITFKDAVDVNPLPPLGLGYIGAVLENAGIEVKIVDCLMEGWDNRVKLDGNEIRIGLSFERIETIIRDYSPDMIGVNSLFTKQRDNAHKIYELAKKLDNNIITVAGGAHPTVLPELVLEDQNVDFVVIGEGEITIIDLVHAIAGEIDINNLDGIGFKENGHIVIIPKTKFIEDIDSIPFPARHLLNMKQYFGLKASHGTRRRNRFSPIITSRGCPAKCTFCSAHRVWGKKFRQRSPENVIAELKELKEKYGIQEIMFEDDNLTANPKRADRIFDLMIEEKLDFVWDTPNGAAAFAMNENLIDKMKKSGCYKLNLALESGNQYVLDNVMNKPVKLERSKELIKYAQSIGLETNIYLIIGMPGETKEQIQDTFRLAREMETHMPHISIATPYPGSELYNICVEKNYLPDDFSLDDLYKRSFLISTENWTAEELRGIYNQGSRSLLMTGIKRHPLKYAKIVGKGLLNHPRALIKRILHIAHGGFR